MNSSRKPAVIVCSPEKGSLTVGALSVLDRLIVSLYRAGCGPIKIVCANTLPSLTRTHSLGINVCTLEQVPEISEPTVLAVCHMVVQPPDIQKLLSEPVRLVDKRGNPLPIGQIARLSKDVESSLKELKTISAEGVAELVEDRQSARRVERLLWDSLKSKTDGVMDTYLNRPAGRPLSKILIHTPVTPNQISIFSMLIGLLAAYGFSKGTYVAGIIGAMLFQVSAIIDCVDGDIARMLFKESFLGKWLDMGADQIVHAALFAAIAVGLHRSGSSAPAALLGISAVVGVLISLVVVLRGMGLPETLRRPELQKLIDSATTRDFSILLMVLSLSDRLDWFLWLTGIGVHIFWIIALGVQLTVRQSGPFNDSDQ